MTYRLGVLALVVLPQVLAPQGVTTAAIQGTVVDEDGVPILGATVQVTHVLNGRRWEVLTRSSGGYLLEDVAVGGPYHIEVRAVGFVPVARTGMALALGQRLLADFTLPPTAIDLTPVTVEASADPILNPGRTGPAEIISAERIATLPNLGRDFLSLTLLSPQVAVSPTSRTAPTGGITIAGQNRLYNSFQIDGGVNHDLYTGRLPGRETLPRPISLEALQEIQVLAAPFDVRHGGFVGGLANAVTRAGTNTVHGSVFGYLSDGAFVGRSNTGDPADDFATHEYGGTLGGPIARDRAHYFVSVDAQRRLVPDPGPLITDTVGGAELANIGVRYASAMRFQDILSNTYRLDPGALGPSNGRVHATDAFGKITLQLGTNSHLELSHHYTQGDRWGFITRTFGDYYLTSTSRADPVTASASRVIWTSLPRGRWSNELIASVLRLRDECRSAANYPEIRVRVDAVGRLLAGGGGGCTSTSQVRQDAVEVTDNVTSGFGAHVVTLGTHIEMLRFQDRPPRGAGTWTFLNLDSLEAGRALQYARTFPGPSSTGVVEFDTRQIGLYLQDRWSPARGLQLTAGLRIDVPVLPDRVDVSVALDSALNIDAGRRPSGTLLWSPRLGINYDLRGAGRTFVRGGIGTFNGRPPYAWLGTSLRDDGAHQLSLICTGTGVPPFDPVNQPTTCANGAGPTPRLTVFDRDVKFPQSFKVTLGVDHRLPGDVVGTVDILYAQAAHQWYFSDANLPDSVGVSPGEGNRRLYGTINTLSGVASPAYRATALGQVVRVSDRSGDQSFAASVQLRKRFRDRAEVSALYAHTHARDRMSDANLGARPNLENTPLDGTLEARRLGTSYFAIPHRVEIGAVVRLPYRVRLSLLYAGASGTSYTYVVSGDANADGIGTSGMSNDIVYLPRNRGDISIDGNGNAAGVGTLLQQDSVYVQLDSFMLAEPCLNVQRGRILARNSCRNPWFGTLNMRLTKLIPTVAGHSLELTADAYNVLNLVNRRWGQSRVTIPGPWIPLLGLAGYDASAGRGVYRMVQSRSALRQLQDLASRWQMELSVRYVF
jgi:hypothetical protein